MADSINVNNLPSTFPAYAGYVDGKWPNYSTIVAKFPNAYHVGYAATTNPANWKAQPNGADIERYDWTVTQSPTAFNHGIRIFYLSPYTVAKLVTLVPRTQIKIITAHYGYGTHICGPNTCNLSPIPADGTQWIDHTTLWDESILLTNFFTNSPSPSLGDNSMVGQIYEYNNIFCVDNVANNQLIHHWFNNGVWSSENVLTASGQSPTAALFPTQTPQINIGSDGILRVAAQDTTGIVWWFYVSNNKWECSRLS